VRYTFFLLAILGAGSRRPLEALVWVVVVFLAILLHELGHAVAARFYRADPAIEIYTLGGLTSWQWPRTPTTGQKVVTSLAGPGIGFLAAALLYALLRAFRPVELPPLASLALSDFLWATVAWGVFNLLPMLPLDGGQTMDALLQRLLGEQRGRRAALVASCVVAAAAALGCLAIGLGWAGVLCAFFAYNSFQRLRGLSELRVA
jgi:Zn-dependent protease